MSSPIKPPFPSGTFALRGENVMVSEGRKPPEMRAAIVVIHNEKIASIRDYDDLPDCPIVEVDGVLLPGLVDSHVHINEPGRTDWEGFDTATHAAAAGGITTLVDMPLNCIPVTTTAQALAEKLEHVDKKLWVDCGYWGGATADNLDDLPDLLSAGVLGVKSFTIHSGIDEFQCVDEAQLLNAMRLLAKAGLPHLVHAELEPSSIQDTSTESLEPADAASQAIPSQAIDTQAIGKSYSRFLASRPKAWENDAIAMVIRVMQTLRDEGLVPRAHIVHLSSSDALPMIAAARAEGLQLTVETCPHYLTLAAETIPDGGTLYKCCPPVREHDNQTKLWQGLKDGVIDFIVSDHSPCTPQLKALDTGDIGDAWGGISALQFGLSLIWTYGQAQDFSLADIVNFMCCKPADIAGIGMFKGRIAVGYDADFCVFDPNAEYTINAECIKHKHKVSPYIGQTVTGLIRQTWLRGHCVFHDDNYMGDATGKSVLRST